MLKTEQILNAKFTPVSRGAYSAEEVDAFLKTAAGAYESSLNANEELMRKISVLADKVEDYRKDEEAIKLSLVDAHRMAATVKKDADEKARAAVGDAENRAKIILDGANRQSSQEIEKARSKAKEIVDAAKTAVDSLTERARRETELAAAAAGAKADEILAAARAEGEKIIGDSKSAYEFYSSEFKKLQSKTSDFKAAIEKVCNGQLRLIENLPSEYFAAVAAVEEPIKTLEGEKEAAPAEPEAGEPAPDENASEPEDSRPRGGGEAPQGREETGNGRPSGEGGEAGEAGRLPAEDDGPRSDEACGATEPVPREAASEDELFGLIDDLNFDDIASPEAIAPGVGGFAPERSDPGESPKTEDEDITSLFNSIFND